MPADEPEFLRPLSPEDEEQHAAREAEQSRAADPVRPDALPLGHEAASVRLRGARGSIFDAFDRLGCGMDHEEALAYLYGSPHFASLPEDIRGKVAGLCMGFALTAVESDRRVRRFGRWFRGR